MKSPGLIGRPLGMAALFCALVLGGLVCWPRLGLDLLPPLTHPRLTVVATWPHATPQEVESLLTRRLEGVLSTVGGLRRLESRSGQGVSNLSLIFAWGADLAGAASQARERLDAVADQLPRRVQPPVVLTYDPAQAPLVTLVLTGPGGGLDLRTHADQVLKPRLETLEGVATVRVAGGLLGEVLVEARADLLAGRGLDLAGLAQGLEQAGREAPAGEVRAGNLTLPVRTVGRFLTPQEVAQAPARPGPGGLVRVDEVARVSASHRDPTGFCRWNQEPAVLLEVLKEAGTSPVEVSGRVGRLAGELAASLPTGWKLQVADDQAPLVASALGSLGWLALGGGLLALVVLLVFLRRLASALLVVLAAPLALAVTGGVMYLAGVGLNLMSIGGLALGLGMLVDASVVVLEAHQRRTAQGQDPLEAAQAALAEVRAGLLAAFAMVAVGVWPVLMAGGLVRRLFGDFIFTLLVSLLVALAVALWLLPALLALGRARPASQTGSGGEGTLSRRYGAWLEACLARPGWVVLAGLGAVILAGALLLPRGASLLPPMESGRLLARLWVAPEKGLAGLSAAADQVQKTLAGRPGVQSWLVRAGVDAGSSQDLGQDPERARQVEVVAHLEPGARRAVAAALAGLARPDQPVEVWPGGALAGLPGEEEGLPQLVRLRGENLDDLARAAEQARVALQKAGFTRLRVQGVAQGRQLELIVDRAAAAGLGVSVERVAQEVRRALEGEVVGRVGWGQDERDLRVRLAPAGRVGPDDLAQLPLAMGEGRLVRLEQVARLEPGSGPRLILRQERQRAALIQGQGPGGALSRQQDQALAALAGLSLPPGVEVLPGASAQEMNQALTGLAGALGLALVLIYVVLVLKFESLLWPLVVLAGLAPVALGPALALAVGDLPLTVLVLLGGVVLLGPAVAGSVLLLDRALVLARQGVPWPTALARAGRRRLRAILISTLTTVLGALPLALSLGPGAYLSRPLALTVAAGLLAALPATLLLAPALARLAGGRARGGS